MNQHAEELKLLRFSIVMAVIYTTIGLTWGLVIQSGIILFDAIYSGVSIVLSFLSLYALKLVKSDSPHPEDVKESRFQMGRTAVEPLVITIKSIVIIVICLYGLTNAVLDLMAGAKGAHNSVAGIGYGVLTALICLCSYAYIRVKGRKLPDLVQAESEQWLIDTVFSVLVMVAFGISFLLEQTAFAHWAPYVDPITVILVSLYFIQVPGKRLLTSLQELLQMTPEESIQTELDEVAKAIANAHQLGQPFVRSTKIGRQLAVDIAFILDDKERRYRIAEFDQIREQIEARLKPLGLSLWLNIIFTHDRHWA
ncbi:cation diffusion facilitator family transporter [Ferrimonas gelatinilytica]|uniref:Cation diffusion facilitator family transporter n=1 Tax=Ferrimonas gelatinilytica TaxID=1255257 RepID=A0ABP9RVB5_9GAMM